MSTRSSTRISRLGAPARSSKTYTAAHPAKSAASVELCADKENIENGSPMHGRSAPRTRSTARGLGSRPASASRKPAATGSKSTKTSSAASSTATRRTRRAPDWSKIHAREAERKERMMAARRKPVTKAEGFNLSVAERAVSRGKSAADEAMEEEEEDATVPCNAAPASPPVVARMTGKDTTRVREPAATTAASQFEADSSALNSILDNTGIQPSTAGSSLLNAFNNFRATIAAGDLVSAASRRRAPAGSDSNQATGTRYDHHHELNMASSIIQDLRERKRASVYVHSSAAIPTTPKAAATAAAVSATPRSVSFARTLTQTAPPPTSSGAEPFQANTSALDSILSNRGVDAHMLTGRATIAASSSTHTAAADGNSESLRRASMRFGALRAAKKRGGETHTHAVTPRSAQLHQSFRQAFLSAGSRTGDIFANAHSNSSAVSVQRQPAQSTPGSVLLQNGQLASSTTQSAMAGQLLRTQRALARATSSPDLLRQPESELALLGTRQPPSTVAAEPVVSADALSEIEQMKQQQARLEEQLQRIIAAQAKAAASSSSAVEEVAEVAPAPVMGLQSPFVKVTSGESAVFALPIGMAEKEEEQEEEEEEEAAAAAVQEEPVVVNLRRASVLSRPRARRKDPCAVVGCGPDLEDAELVAVFGDAELVPAASRGVACTRAELLATPPPAVETAADDESDEQPATAEGMGHAELVAAGLAQPTDAELATQALALGLEDEDIRASFRPVFLPPLTC